LTGAAKLARLACGAALCAAFAGCNGAAGTIAKIPTGVTYPSSGVPWLTFASNEWHDADSSIASQPLDRIHWQQPVDLAPPDAVAKLSVRPAGAEELLIHYGSPIFTAADSVIVPVKTSSTGTYRVDVRHAATGALIWQYTSDYVVPAHNWWPSYNVALTPQNQLYFPGAGGKLYYRDDPDVSSGTINTAVFYGQSTYNADPSAYNASIMINTPITSDSHGDVFFGFTVAGTNPDNIQGGIARIDANGNGTWVAAATAAGDPSVTQAAMNSAPALSPDESTVYVAVASSQDWSYGYLLGLNSTTLATEYKAWPTDPASGMQSYIVQDGTASPMVGPDGDVYFGVLENPESSHNDRGWLLHYDSTLTTIKTPGSFGWDDTPSLVPTSMVPSYTGTSPYLLFTKYNNYAGIGTGNGHNEIAVLDPDATEPDPIISTTTVMKEVLTIEGVTPDPENPGGVKEWCINSAAVDPFSKVILAPSEDGHVYRWDMTTNTFTQSIQVSTGIGEAYTPSIVEPDGQVFSIQDATLFAIGE